jgi:hypothetical protein
MPTTYSSNLRLLLLATGENSGTWGNLTNTNLGNLLEQAITGVNSVAVSDVGDTTLTALDGAVDQARNAVLVLTGSLSAQRSLIVPTVDKVYTFRNLTGQPVLVKTAAGTGVVIANGYTCSVYCDAANVFRASPMIDHTTNTISATNGAFTNMPTAGGNPVVPSGVIWMWSGSIASIPAGWALCNGSSGTPNLMDRFIVGAGSAYAPGATGGSLTTSEAGSHTHGEFGTTEFTALTVAQMPAHQHTGTTDPNGSHNHALPRSAIGAGGANPGFSAGSLYDPTGPIDNTELNGLHTHNFTTNFQGSGEGHVHAISAAGTHTHTVTPPYYALAFIMKL